MARVRLIGPEPVSVPELGGRTVEPDEIVEVPDERFEAYVCQTQTWEAIDEPRATEPRATELEVPADAPRLSVKKAARPQKDEV
ncbi:hypothetical protein [Streptomyces sp. NPDC088785]|uniref:hypothetical protein n=1 Tax=Streptomyces sp. NPDC088785 TaxID=3365897 RepID=UPI003810C7EC